MNGKERALVPLSHQSLNGAENCSVQLRAANVFLLCLLGKARIIEILKDEKQDWKKEKNEEKSVGKRKEKATTRREVWEWEAREAKKAWSNEKAQKKKEK